MIQEYVKMHSFAQGCPFSHNGLEILAFLCKFPAFPFFFPNILGFKLSIKNNNNNKNCLKISQLIQKL